MILQRRARAMIWLVIFLSLSFSTFGLSARAQEQAGVSLTASVGLNGYCKEGRWIPVRVAVENTGADVNGRVQLSYRNSEGGETVIGQDVSLPNTSRKEFFLYFYPQGFVRALKISLIADGKVLAGDDFNLSCLTQENQIYGVLTDSPSAYANLGDVHPLTGFVKAAPLQIADLPDRPQGWQALDALIVSGVDTAQLTEAQRDSLAVWLSNGGRLLAVGGPKWELMAAGLKDLLPLDIKSVQNVENLSALPAYYQDESPLEEEAVIAIGSLTENARVLIEQDGLPLVVEKEVGFGKVIYLAADPALRPLSEWDAMTEVYAGLLGVRPARLKWVDGSWDTYASNTAVSAIGTSDIPSSFYVCGWLVLYVLVVGPVNFLFIRRTKRRELAWITIPILVIVFSAVAYFYGFVYRGQRPILNRVAVVQAWEGSEQAEVRAMAGVYSPKRDKYSLESADSFMLFPTNDNSSGLQTGNDWLTLDTGSGMVVPDVSVEIGGLQAVAAQGNIPALSINHDLSVLVSGQAPALTGTITNSSGLILKDAVLFTSGDMRQLGDLAPGGTANVRVSLTALPNGPAFYNLDSWSILDMDYYADSDNVEMNRRRAMLDMLLNETNYYYNSNDGNWGVYLMAWLEEPILPVVVKGDAYDAIDTTLYIVRLTPSFEFSGTEWRVTSSLLAWESTFPGATPYYSSEIPAGGYELRFHPVLPMTISSVEELFLEVNVRSAINPQTLIAFLWDFENEEWVQVENMTLGTTSIPAPARYFGPGGEVRLKIDNSTTDYMEVSPSAITLLVKP